MYSNSIYFRPQSTNIGTTLQPNYILIGDMDLRVQLFTTHSTPKNAFATVCFCCCGDGYILHSDAVVELGVV